ncbi:MAG: redoxin domain-containing protein [Saprospiraceae bacterium]|nr:redoxin domain-containing protein [Saprospiraceae bacterium]
MLSALMMCFSLWNYAQMTMHNFTVTDSDGQIHNLYTSHLDQGKTVVIKFFFTTCPPCIAITPQWQSKYVAWGSGDYDVEFMEASILTSDSNAKVTTFKNTYNLTMVGIGNDGNASDVTFPFMNGNYGSWWGTPSFAVISPDRTLNYPVFFAELDAAIAATGAEMPGPQVPDPTTVQLFLQTYNVDIPTNHLKFFVKPKNTATPKIEITKNGSGNYEFIYPSEEIPEMVEPEIIMESVGPAYTSKVSAADIVTIQKHILGLETLNPPYKQVASDVTNDGKITAFDLVNIRKLILGLITEFPNGTPSYRSIPSTQNVIEDPGHTVIVNMSIVKMGNVN